VAGAPDPFPVGTGGGIYNSGGTLTITNSTVSGNAASGQHDGQPGARTAASLAAVPSPTALSATTMLPSQVAVLKAARH